jgi:hypothetical protein
MARPRIPFISEFSVRSSGSGPVGDLYLDLAVMRSLRPQEFIEGKLPLRRKDPLGRFIRQALLAMRKIHGRRRSGSCN